MIHTMFDKTAYLYLLFKYVLPESLSNSLKVSDILIFSESVNMVCILF